MNKKNILMCLTGLVLTGCVSSPEEFPKLGPLYPVKEKTTYYQKIDAPSRLKEYGLIGARFLDDFEFYELVVPTTLSR